MGGGAGERLQALLATREEEDGKEGSSSDSSEDSSSDEDEEEDTPTTKADPVKDTPLFDNVLAPPIPESGKPTLQIRINASQPLVISLPATTTTSDDPPIYTYPPSCIPLKYLSERTQQIKLARFLPCRTEGCDCTGLKPPNWRSTTDPPSTSADTNEETKGKTSQIILWAPPASSNLSVANREALDPLARTISTEHLWDACGACGCAWDDGEGKAGHTLPSGEERVDRDEVQRRRRVAHRAEEMLEVRVSPPPPETACWGADQLIR